MRIAGRSWMGTAPSGAFPFARAGPSTAHASIPPVPFFPTASPLPPAQAKPFLRNRQLSSGQGGALSSFPPAACGIFTLDLGVHAEYFSGSRNSRERDRDQRDSRSGSGGPERQQ